MINHSKIISWPLAYIKTVWRKDQTSAKAINGFSLTSLESVTVRLPIFRTSSLHFLRIIFVSLAMLGILTYYFEYFCSFWSMVIRFYFDQFKSSVSVSNRKNEMIMLKTTISFLSIFNSHCSNNKLVHKRALMITRFASQTRSMPFAYGFLVLGVSLYFIIFLQYKIEFTQQFPI